MQTAFFRKSMRLAAENVDETEVREETQKITPQ